MSRTLISNGTLVDGSGRPSFRGHLLISQDRIEALLPQESLPPQVDTEIDAHGQVVAPGFIDMHSHADWQLPLADHPSLLRCLPEQGVTTIVGGNCGFSPAPVNNTSVALLDRNLSALLMDKPLDYSWRTLGEFMDRVESTRPIVNTALLVGHATTRILTSGLHDKNLPGDTARANLASAEQSLAEGACGISLGLGYEPGMYAPLEELIGFFQIAARCNKPITVHLKALSRLSPTYPITCVKPHSLRALEEMIDLAKKTGAKLQLSHFIFVGRRSWPLFKQALDRVDQARNQGVDIMIDAFPYTCGNTTINVVFPYWFMRGLPDAYHRKRSRARLWAELELGFRLVGFSYKDFQVMDARTEGWQRFNGSRVTDIAAEWGTSPFQALLKLSEGSHGNALMLFHAYSGEPGYDAPLEAVLSHDACLFETDAIIKSRGYPNPATLGTFPRILGHCVRRRRLFTLEEAVRRMTGASAERFGLTDRGTLAPGKKADIVIFDPDTISDQPPTDSSPTGRPRGIRQVLINGTLAVDNGDYIDGVRAGAVLRV